jgi:hypothetical protein
MRKLMHMTIMIPQPNGTWLAVTLKDVSVPEKNECTPAPVVTSPTTCHNIARWGLNMLQYYPPATFHPGMHEWVHDTSYIQNSYMAQLLSHTHQRQ